ncbi:C2H2-like zinc finger protein [Quillaja saponaria]|uniref:C2H2-like zinc finger protein n=1 Tax=Quillaja saponaria TaxID=32244 RepID=A0AAD7VKK3_QUISA|nr:C2H2-like zinc finger protein [Quillaja saponaria]
MMGANFNEPATSINGLGLPGLNRRVTHTRRTTITPLGVVRVETVVEYYPTQNPSIFPPNEVVRTAPPTQNPSIFSQNEAVRTNGFVTAANPIRYFNNFTKNNGFSHTNMRKKRHVVNDGRIHSLPHRKFGPYRCPKCLNIFQTSQQFAAHAVSQHYKFESAEEKTRRRDARFNKRNVQQGRN